MKDFFVNLLNALGLAIWIEIETQSPLCIYYFGPFASVGAARTALPGFLEDLEAEEAQGICTTIARCKPRKLTIEQEEPFLPLPPPPSMAAFL